jgi:hypothetical protein
VIHGIEVFVQTIDWGKIDWGKTAVAVGGGIAGTLGAIKTAQEILRSFGGKRIAVERELTSSVEVGNTVNLANLTDKPLLVSNVEVVWARRGLLGRKITYRPTDFDWTNGFTIPPHGRIPFNYADADYFSTSAATRKMHGHLFFLVWITGEKKPKWFDID